MGTYTKTVHNYIIYHGNKNQNSLYHTSMKTHK